MTKKPRGPFGNSAGRPSGPRFNIPYEGDDSAGMTKKPRGPFGNSAGRPSGPRFNQSVDNYGPRTMPYGNRDVTFIAGILTGILIALVGVAVVAFII